MDQYCHRKLQLPNKGVLLLYGHVVRFHQGIFEADDVFNSESTHFGQIDFVRGKIVVNSALSEDAKNETIVHEVTHGILVYIGRSDLSQDEQFVQAIKDLT